jgi:hypothetical protein
MEYAMNETVISMIQSRTIWAAVATIIIWFIQRAGFETGKVDINSLTDILLQVVGGLSALATIYFRITANAKISGVITPKPVEVK